MRIYSRILAKKLINSCFKGKIIMLVGARQTGKTTLSNTVLEHFGKEIHVKKFNGDDPIDRELLTNKSLTALQQLIGNANFVFIDEGQKVGTIGQTLKLLVDHYGDSIQILVTGSSSMHLLDATQEPLTGRKYPYTLHPLSLSEIEPIYDPLSITKQQEERLIYGSYPHVTQLPSLKEKVQELKEITSSYLYRDILEFQQIKNPDILHKLLQALALQTGSEVSYTELSGLIGIDKNTVEKYVQLLEQSFVLFRLSPYGRNKRREISKLRKIFFWDTGIRNTLIQNFNPLSLRNDAGRLFENWMIAERMKKNSYEQKLVSSYFWRTYDGNEIDYIEEINQEKKGYEFRYKKQKSTRPFEKGEVQTSLITPEQIKDFLY
ncbi:ATPase [Candidatus Roizmanbacteria bacterium CG_4_10_14_0_8_um_filter_39_9]|uniref:ATPase n=1 Tax=Candidatus Roizmanbacteria bacterium CG_4_10_14_0_8_um_filter_39_9 TaxID=1974829 RepID=A0A2M7QDN1_9BACT|nr:MAG: ATPase [Candidatus Roizmanbacteria bacterium CG_4_10_14_0_8_um_filter_39_9]